MLISHTHLLRPFSSGHGRLLHNLIEILQCNNPNGQLKAFTFFTAQLFHLNASLASWPTYSLLRVFVTADNSWKYARIWVNCNSLPIYIAMKKNAQKLFERKLNWNWTQFKQKTLSARALPCPIQAEVKEESIALSAIYAFIAYIKMFTLEWVPNRQQ